MSEKATIMMVDDHPLFRKGIRQLIELEEELDIVAEAKNGEEGLSKAKELEPDLILLDLNMQGMDGLDTLRAIRAAGVDSRIIMLTVSDNEADVVNCFRAGADGYLLKDMEPEDILEKIKQVTLGKMAISERLTEILASALRKPVEAADPSASLTSREYEILTRIAQGHSNKVIARDLNISDGTVKVHVKHILKKMGMRSRVEAAVWLVNRKG
ncbi:Response regulator containing a CheY-like receiver domain and an HTH DNA-binding domain [Hahella chejuensis KCTC 2396]|uniref:Response regulator containing a CheY-like receiver domain and an HTH DNA-binding domain n=1 Tax=Hahella chejuensis (strain KCTC 2396) TaxID=349521 RepID=Q2SF37_HAHCH|nr:two-component system response regulator NarL [Hahella chejuensis]ABC30737.1 Response regulator containing a CheY-like receiver domain and an HTH DNA-binding domain [Hahella chejuensis KCTC 2396]